MRERIARWFLLVVLCCVAATAQEIPAAAAQEIPAAATQEIPTAATQEIPPVQPNTEQVSRVRRHLPGAEAGPPYPRLGILTWYTPRDFAARVRDKTGGQITLNDPEKSALMDFLSTRQFVEVVAGSYLDTSPPVVADRDRLAQARANAGFRLLAVWGSSGNEPYNLSFTKTGQNSPWPFVPEWFVQEPLQPLPTAIHVGDMALPIANRDLNAYCIERDTGFDNDEVIIMDADRAKREAVILKCSIWNGSSNSIHLATGPELRSPYDFGAFKYDHAAGTAVRLNLWHDWGNWWGYNMTDVGPVGPAGTPYEGLRWNEYRPRIIHSQFKQIRDSQNRLLLDGLILDTFNQEWFGPWSSRPAIVPRLDLDADGVPDWEEQNSGVPGHDPTGCSPDYWSGLPNWDNCAWAAGETTFTQNLRALWDQDPELQIAHNILVQHCFGENAEYLNGQSFEGIPSLELSADMHANHWQTAFEHYRYWEENGRAPQVVFIFTNCPNPPDSPASYQQMRLALAFTLMGGGYFMPSPYFPDISAFNGDQLWWFDEYAVDGQGRAIDVYAKPALHALVNIRTDLLEQGQFATTVRPGLGYLGHPRGPARVLAAGVYRRDFQRGLVLANFSGAAVSLTLERPFRRIAGVQDRATNDGSLVTSLELPAKDGLVLLDPAVLAAADAR